MSNHNIVFSENGCIIRLRTRNVTKELETISPISMEIQVHTCWCATRTKEPRGSYTKILKGKREALAPRRRRPAGAAAAGAVAAQSERLQDTFFTCEDLDQPLRSTKQNKERMRRIALPRRFCNGDLTDYRWCSPGSRAPRPPGRSATAR